MSTLGAQMALAGAWAIEEPALHRLLEIASREHEVTLKALAAYKAQTLEKGERATQRNGVAVLNAEGPLFKRANLLTEYCGASSYDVLMRDFQAALDDDSIRAILWNMDSPGGEAAGCGELASAIAAARGKKPIVAYAGDQASSAAYWIASACDTIVIGAGAAVGSIGVRCTVPDTSARDARSGVTRHEFVSSQSPYKASDPKTDEGRARLQARVDALAQVFVEAVAANRGVSTAHVLQAFGKGDVLFGAAAVAAGLADSLGTFESVIGNLAKSASTAFIRRPAAKPSSAGVAAPPASKSAADLAYEAARAAALARVEAERRERAEAEAARAARAQEADAAFAAIMAARAHRLGK